MNETFDVPLEQKDFSTNNILDNSSDSSPVGVRMPTIKERVHHPPKYPKGYFQKQNSVNNKELTSNIMRKIKTNINRSQANSPTKTKEMYRNRMKSIESKEIHSTKKNFRESNCNLVSLIS